MAPNDDTVCHCQYSQYLQIMHLLCSGHYSSAFGASDNTPSNSVYYVDDINSCAKESTIGDWGGDMNKWGDGYLRGTAM